MRNSSPSTRGQQRYIRSNEGFRTDSTRSKDDDLALFHDMRVCENKNFLQLASDDIEASLSTKLGGLTGFRISTSQTPPWKGNDLLATADAEKNDYDWLLTPPGTPLFPSLDQDSLESYMDRGVLKQPYSASKISRFSASHTSELDHKFSRRSPGPRTPTNTVSSTTSTYSAARNRAPSPSRAILSPTLRPASPAKTLARSTTMLNRSSATSSPPVLRRTNTSPNVRSSSTERNAPPLKGRSRGASVSPKLQAWQAPELGFSAEPPPNLRTSLDRPTSSSRNTSSRPRVGNHVEARHSYSESIDGRQPHAVDSRHSHRRHSSSSASKLSSSTTSQDRWSSRGSVISSSDDGTDVLEPTFLDFSVMSPSSTSGTSRTFTGRYENEVSSRCSPVANRQRTLSTYSNLETAGFSSASARKSLEPSMQRVDHRRVSQSMFRPLLSSAPTTSFCNIGQTVIRHRPTNSFAEHSITASSNASSEKGVRIFPGNESSDDGDCEVESEWDKSLPPGPAMSKFEVDEHDAIHEEYNSVHDHGVQCDWESVADSASCAMDVIVDGGADRTMYIDTPDWPAHKVHPERNQASGETASQGGGESSSLPKSVINEIEHDPIEKDAVSRPIQLANTDQAFVDIQEDTSMQQKSSTWLHCDSANSQKFCHGPDNPELPNQGASPSFQEPLKPEQERLHEATCKAVEGSIMRSPQRIISTHVFSTTKQSPHGRKLDTEQPVIENITNARMSPTMSYHKDVSLRPQKMVDCAFSTEPALLIDAEDCPDGKQSQGADLPKISLHEIRAGAVMDGESSERLHVTKTTFSSSTTTSERVPSSVHLETEENSPLENPTSIGLSNHHLSSQEDPSVCPPTPSSQEQEGSSQQPEPASQDSCHEYYIDMSEHQEKISTREPKGGSFSTSPRKLSYADSEGPFDSDKCSGKNEVDYSQAYAKAHAINMNEVGEQVKEVLSHDGHVQPGLSEDKHKSAHGSVLMNELPLSSSQDFKGHDEVKENSTNDLNHNTDVDADKSSEQCVVIDASADASDELDQLNLQAGDLAKDLVLSEDSSQSFTETWPPEVVSEQRDAQEPVLPANISQTIGVEDTGIQAIATLFSESQQQPHSTESSLKTQASPRWKPATPRFSLEEATNTILFCSSIVHDMVYKATSIATEKEAANIAAAAPLSYQVKGPLSNTDFINSLRGKVSKSAAWKRRSKEGKSLMKKPQGEELTKPLATITQHPPPIDGMEKGPAKLEEAEKAIADNIKEKSFMGLSVNSNCQCIVM